MEKKAEGVQAFQDYEGQTALLDRLVRDFQAGQFVHAYLFLGPDGVGKASIARLLAMTAVCTHSGAESAPPSLMLGLDAPSQPERAPCGVCGPCVRVSAGTHPDVTQVDIGKSMGVDAMRELLAQVQVRAYEGGAKVVILRGAERMTVQAQNCLLKTLEEPPPGTCFILTAKVQSALLPTILSRCRLVRFHPLTQEAAHRRLEALGMEGTRAALLAHQSEGCVGVALSMAADQGYFERLSRVDKALFGIRRPSDVVAVSAQFKDEKDNADKLLTIAEQLFRDAMRMRLAGGAPMDLGYSEDFAAYVRAADVRASVRVLEAIRRARQMRASNVPFASVWEQILLTIAEEYKKWQW